MRATPYQQLLGDAYERLHPHVRLAHEAPLTATGFVDVVHGAHPLTPFFVGAMKLPAAGVRQPVTLHVTLIDPPGGRAPTTMAWSRHIGGTPLDTRQFAREGRLIEQSGPGTVEFDLRVENGELVYQQAACRYLRVRLPHSAPQVRARVAPAADGWRVEVVVEWRGLVICRYGGEMQRVRSA